MDAYKDDPKIDLVRDAISDIRKADLFKSMWVRRHVLWQRILKKLCGNFELL